MKTKSMKLQTTSLRRAFIPLAIGFALLIDSSSARAALVFEAGFNGSGGGTGGVSDVVNLGGTGVIYVPPPTSTATGGVQSTAPTLGGGSYLHTAVPADSGGGGSGVIANFTPTADASSWAAMATKPGSQLLLNGAFDTFFRINQGTLADNTFKPFDFGSASASQVRFQLGNLNPGGALRLYITGTTNWYVAGSTAGSSHGLAVANATQIYYDFTVPTITLGTINHVALTLSSNSTTGLATVNLYTRADNQAINYSTDGRGYLTFNIDESVMTGSTFFKTGAWSFGDQSRQSGAAKSVDMDMVRLYNAVPTEIAAIPEPTTWALLAFSLTTVMGSSAKSVLTEGKQGKR